MHYSHMHYLHMHLKCISNAYENNAYENNALSQNAYFLNVMNNALCPECILICILKCILNEFEMHYGHNAFGKYAFQMHLKCIVAIMHCEMHLKMHLKCIWILKCI